MSRVGGGAPCQPFGCRFLRRRPPNRTCEFPRIRLSTDAAVGDLCPLVQLALEVKYPQLRLIKAGQRRAGVHQRPPSLRTCRASAGTLPHVPGFPRLGVLRSLRHAPAATADGAPAPNPTGVRRAPPGRFPRSPATGRQGRRPALPLRHRHAAPQHTARPRPPDLLPSRRDGLHVPGRIEHRDSPQPPVSGLVTCRGASTTGSVSLRLSALLARPGPLAASRRYLVGAAPARTAHPSSQAAPSFNRPSRRPAVGLSTHPVEWRLVAHRTRRRSVSGRACRR